MASTHKTFGDFFDEVRDKGDIENGVCVDNWKDSLAYQASWWIRMQEMEITEELISYFAKDMIAMRVGREFLEEIRVAAERFGIDVSSLVEAPVRSIETASAR